ncbi:hypothetical protein BHE74_00005418 [Ensete ventricosum]|nr:hypothetical protein BHE74_00005418 [Ensete ventricosum]
MAETEEEKRNLALELKAMAKAAAVGGRWNKCVGHMMASLLGLASNCSSPLAVPSRHPKHETIVRSQRSRSLSASLYSLIILMLWRTNPRTTGSSPCRSKMRWLLSVVGLYAVAEESARLGSARMRKLIRVDREETRKFEIGPPSLGCASRDAPAWICVSYFFSRFVEGSCIKASQGWVREPPPVPYPGVAFILARRRLTVPRSLISSVSFAEVTCNIVWSSSVVPILDDIVCGFASSSLSSSSDIDCARSAEGVV